MASLTGQSIASSYEQLLHVDRDGGGNGTTLVDIKDGDNGTTFALKIATDKIQVGDSSTADSTIVIESSASGDPLLNFISTSNRSAIIRFTEGSTTEGLIIYEHNGDNLKFVTGSANASSARFVVNETSSYFTSNLGIGGQPSSPLTVIGNYDSGNNKGSVLIQSSLDTAVGTVLDLFHNSASPAANDFVGLIRGMGNDSAGNLTEYGSIGVYIEDPTSTGEDGYIRFNTSENGTASERMRINSAGNVGIGISPETSQKLHVKVASNVNFTTSANGSSLRLNAVNDAVSATIPLEINSTSTQFLSDVSIGTSAAYGNLTVGGTGELIAGRASSGAGSFSMYEAGTTRFVIESLNGSNGIAFKVPSTEAMRIDSSGNILPGTDDAQDLGSSSKRFDDIHATNGTIQTSDERLKDNIADSSLGLDFVNALRPVKYKWKDYSYDVEKEKAVEAKEAEYETVVVQEAVEAKEAVMGTRQKTVSKEVEKTRTEIVEEDGKYVQKEISYTETVKEPQYEEVNLYDEDGNKIQRLVSEAIEAVEGVEAKDAVYEDVLHKIPVMEEYEVEPAVEAVEEVTEERLVSEAIEAKDAVMETKEKTFARTHFGLIAQEVEQVLKDSSLTNNDFAGLIYDEDSDRYGMRYHELIAPLIKAVQELSAKVEELEKK